MKLREASQQRTRRRLRALASAAASVAIVGQNALAGTSTNSSGAATQNGVGNPAVTISLSGSTAIRNFTTSPGSTLLTPGTSITLSNGPGGADTIYTARDGSSTSFQLASGNFTTVDQGGPFPSSSTTQTHSALRLEWHEQGSVEGIIDLANDQIGYLGTTPLVDPATRNPVQQPGTAAFSNPIWVNGNQFNGTAGRAVPSTTGQPATFINGHGLNYSTYNTYTDYNSAGVNLQGGQNRVQMAISDVNGAQAFAVSGANGSISATPQTAGYGRGNSAAGLAIGSLPNNAPAQAGAVWRLADQSVLNMSTDKINPATGANYAAGAWNSAGVNNLNNTPIAVTATLFVANPGTGLTQLHRGDAQFLQATGRLANGADFNMTTRDVGSGTRNVAALNTGVDPSWAVGKNDSGNGNNQLAGQDAQAQLNIGSAMRFSNKTAGGGQLRPTVVNNRMAIGTLSMSDAIARVRDNSSAQPLRGLSYSDSADGSSGYVRASASTITDGTYSIYQNETYVTIKAPGAAFAGDTAAQWAARRDSETGILGDNAGHDVADFRANVTNSVANFPAASVANPADSLLANSLILPQMMQVEKGLDGIGQSVANPNFNQAQHDAFVGSVYANNFAVGDPSTITTGNASTYGNGGNNTGLFNGQVPITAQNYLFGNFNQNGTRDFNAIKSAVAAQAALNAHGVSVFTADGGDANSTHITGISPALDAMNSGTGATKGDLIVMGDFNGDGRFDGQDLYLLARGAALADNNTTDRLTTASGVTFGDQVRNGLLRKNAALDYLQSSSTAQQRLDARANATNDPTGANAYNKFDVNRDGLVSRNDAAVVDKFNGKDYRNLADQLQATIATDGSVNSSLSQKTISLVDVELTDNGLIDRSDFNLIRAALGAGLIDGDANFDGKVNAADFVLLSNNFGGHTSRFGLGDFNGDGVVNAADFVLLSNHFGQGGTLTAVQLAKFNAIGSLAGLSAAELKHLDSEITVAVPEPGTLGLMGLAAVGLLRRRRRAN